MGLHHFRCRGIIRVHSWTIVRSWLGILMLTLLLSANSQAADDDGPLFQQLAATVSAEGVAGHAVNLDDFASKAQATIQTMRPGGQLQNLHAVSVADWSTVIANRFSAYLQALYQADIDALGTNWIVQKLGEWQATGGPVALLSWAVRLDGVDYPFDSVAVFDANGQLLFDTILVRTVTSAEVQPDTAQYRPYSVTSSDSEKVTGRYTVSNFFGSKKLTYEVNLKAEVAPYITAATNDASMTMTATVKTGNNGGTGIWPVADPQVYFGTGGSFNVINSSAAKTPFKSRISVSSPDVFQDGSYRVSGNDLGSGINFDLSFGVSVSGKGVGGSVGISIPGPGPLILVGSNSSAAELYLGDVLYCDNACLRYRGNFRNGGNFKLSDFLIRTTDGGGETGSVSASIPVYMAHEGVGVLELTGKLAGTLSPRASYVRGDHLQQPSYTVSADKETVKVGDEVTITVQVKNNSGAVDIQDGSVTLDAGTLNGFLTPTSPTVVDFDSIGSFSTDSATFTLTALKAGQVTVQAEVDGRWGSPVPPEVTIDKRVSLDQPIEITSDDNGGPPEGTGEAALESPREGSFESGIGLVRGWVCDAQAIQIQIDGRTPQLVSYGTNRADTREACGDANNGFGITVNWNNYGDGPHTLRLLIDGEEYTHVDFNVTTLGVDYLRDASGQYTLTDFPETGGDVTVRWSEPHQNFVIMDATLPQFAPLDTEQSLIVSPLLTTAAQLESPQQGSFESGIGLIRGWVCDADVIEIQIDDRSPQRVGYGTHRGDTVDVCSDADNGFGFTVNWNNYGDGPHILRAYADGEQFAEVNFTVTTLGEDYLRGASGQYSLEDFPSAGHEVTVRWSEPHQNFVITNYQ
ncbi:MAG: hypothetical protein H6969_03620 [Gammaproteobacteria bacterium]|nr:hypothetical protein [Gammaproteobacteria bacterium]